MLPHANSKQALLIFLASDQASYITGTLVDVSGRKLAMQIPAVAHGR